MLRNYPLVKLSMIVIFLSFLTFSCGDRPFYSEVRNLPKQTWNDDEGAVFEFEIKDTTVAYNLNFFLRVGTNYAFNNAWVYLHTTLPDGKKFKEAHQFYISNDLGEWLGKKSGSLVESKMLFEKKKFPQIGKYKFVVEQATTQKQLKDVEAIGLIIRKTDLGKKES